MVSNVQFTVDQDVNNDLKEIRNEETRLDELILNFALLILLI